MVDVAENGNHSVTGFIVIITHPCYIGQYSVILTYCQQPAYGISLTEQFLCYAF